MALEPVSLGPEATCFTQYLLCDCLAWTDLG